MGLLDGGSQNTPLRFSGTLTSHILPPLLKRNTDIKIKQVPRAQLSSSVEMAVSL